MFFFAALGPKSVQSLGALSCFNYYKNDLYFGILTNKGKKREFFFIGNFLENDFWMTWIGSIFSSADPGSGSASASKLNGSLARNQSMCIYFSLIPGATVCE